MIDRRIKEHLIAIGLVLLLSLFFFRSLLVFDTNKIIINGDLIFPAKLGNLISLFYPAWNEQLSDSSLWRAGRLYFYAPLFLISYILSLSSMNLVVMQYILIEIIAGLSMYYSAYQILKINNGKSDNNRFLGALISAIVYMTSPFIIQRSHHTFMLIGYSFAPLIIYFLITGLHDKKLKYFIYSAFFWSVASGDPHWVLLDAIILLGYFAYDVVISITEKNFTKQKNFYISSFVVLIACYFLFSAYWLLPLLASTRYTNNALQPSYVLGKDTVQVLSDQSSFINAFQFKTYWLDQQGYTPIPEYLSNPLIQEISIISGFLPILIGLLGFTIKPKNKFMIFFAILTVTTILLSTGAKEFIGALYLWIIFKAPFSSVYGWLLRSPQEFISLSILANSFLIAFTIETITNLKKTVNPILKKVPTLLIIVILLSTFFASWPLFTGDFNNDLKPTEIPKEYYSANQWLGTQGGDFKVIWMPTFNSKDAIWNPGHGSGMFDYEFSDRATYSIYSYPAFENYYSYILGIEQAPNSVLLQNESAYIGKYLQPLNVRYLIFHNDVVEELGENGLEVGLNNLKSQKDLKLVEQDGFISIFENENYADHLSVPQQNILVLGGLNKFTFLNSIGSFSPINTSLFFLDGSYAQNNNKYESILTTDGLIADESSLDLSLSFLDDAYLIKPFDYATDTYPSEFWSKAATNDPANGEWHPYLEEFGIENWQFDYNKGLVFTFSPSKSDTEEKDLKMNFETNASENYHLFIRYFKNQDGGEIKIFLDGREIPLETKDELNKFIWKDLGVFYLQDGEHSVAIKNVDGFNAVNLFALVPNNELVELEKEVDKSLENKTIIYIFEAEYDIYGENVSLEGRSDASDGKVVAFSPQGKAWQEFEILKDGYYQLGIKAEGSFDITVDNLTFPLSSKDLNFVYPEPLYLKKGLHKIEFEPKDLYPSTQNFSSQDQVEECKEITPLSGLTYIAPWCAEEKALKAELCNSTSRQEDKIAYLDSIMLYYVNPSQTNKTIEDLFKTNEPPVNISFTKINPTLWKVQVNASKPFMLSLAESYDPLWEATVYKDGKKIETINPIPLYNILNGFWINQTGSINIEIKYKSQDWLETGLIISCLTLLTALLYLFYDWLRDRGKPRGQLHELIEPNKEFKMRILRG